MDQKTGSGQLAQYFSISTILRKAPGQYVESYLKTETDGNDATYFVIYQLEVIERAINSLNQYIAKKTLEVAEVEQIALSVPGLNRRQIAVINAAQREPYRSFTIDEHKSHEQVHIPVGPHRSIAIGRVGTALKSSSGQALRIPKQRQPLCSAPIPRQIASMKY